MNNKKLSDTNELKIGVANGDLASDFYQKSPCTIGYSYLRIEVDGLIRACCIARYPVGHTSQESWQDTWNSRRMDAFRDKMKTINKTHFHLHDPEWGFCQQCSHFKLNMENNDLINSPYETEEEVPALPENQNLSGVSEIKNTKGWFTRTFLSLFKL